MTESPYTIPAIVAVALLTVAIGAYGIRFARTTSDFLVASRTVSPRWNAAAIGGEYLSAASFLGVAGLVLKYGVDVLWYPVGFAAELYSELATLSGDEGARRLVARYPAHGVELPDAGVLMDLDTEADLQALRTVHAARRRTVTAG